MLPASRATAEEPKPQIVTSSPLGPPLSDANRCRLLVSIRSAAEAQVALSAGVHWIDLKEPDAGPLGAPTLEIARQVAETLGSHAARSVALGEFHSLNLEDTLSLASLFPVVKVGLSGMKSLLDSSDDADRSQTSFNPTWLSLTRLSASVAERGSQLVPVLYADWQNCEGISPSQWLRLCALISSKFALIDTFQKDGRSLFDHIDIGVVENCRQNLEGFGCRLLVAGSLQLEHLERLSPLPLEAVGIRGAVCEETRESTISPTKLTRWLQHPAFS